MQIHASIRMWRKLDKDADDLDRLSKEICRCAFNWQNEETRRRDHVWIQEYHSNVINRSDNQHSWDERMIEQLQLVIIVLNRKRHDRKSKPLRYIDAMIELLKMRNKNVIDIIHDMIEMKKWSKSTNACSRDLTNRRFYILTSIIRSAHVISEAESSSHVDYINNLIDWDQYNILYDKNFQKKKMRAANQTKKKTLKEQRERMNRNTSR